MFSCDIENCDRKSASNLITPMKFNSKSHWKRGTDSLSTFAFPSWDSNFSGQGSLKWDPFGGKIKQGAKPLWCSRMLEPTSGLVKFEKTDSTGWLILVRLWVSWIGVWLVNSLTVLVLPCVSFSTFLSCKTKSVNIHLRKFEIWLNKLNWMCKFLLQHAFKTIFAVCKQVHCNWCTRNCPPVRGTDPLLEAQAELGTVGLLFSVGFGVVGRVVFADFRTHDFPKQKKVTTSKSYI